MSEIEIITDGGRRRRRGVAEKPRIVEETLDGQARKYSERPEHVHDGTVIVMCSNLRWCSDEFEFTCWNGDVDRVALIIDAHDREIVA